MSPLSGVPLGQGLEVSRAKRPLSVRSLGTISTEVTIACGGPPRHQVIARSTAARSPSKQASTRPSGRLRHSPGHPGPRRCVGMTSGSPTLDPPGDEQPPPDRLRPPGRLRTVSGHGWHTSHRNVDRPPRGSAGRPQAPGTRPALPAVGTVAFLVAARRRRGSTYWASRSDEPRWATAARSVDRTARCNRATSTPDSEPAGRRDRAPPRRGLRRSRCCRSRPRSAGP